MGRLIHEIDLYTYVYINFSETICHQVPGRISCQLLNILSLLSSRIIKYNDPVNPGKKEIGCVGKEKEVK